MVKNSAFGDKLLKRFSAALDAVYAAALEPSKWSAAMGQIAALHNSHKSLLLTPATAPDAGGFAFPHGLSESFLQLWATKYIEKDVWTIGAMKKGLVTEGKVWLGDDLVPQPEFEESEMYLDFLGRHDIRHMCTGVVFDGSSKALPVTAVTLFRGVNATNFSDQDRALHSLTTHHASRALGTMFRLRDAELRLAANIAALDRLNSGVVLFGAAGNVTFANSAAMNVFRREDGLRLHAGNPLTDGIGWLGAVNSESDASVRSEIAAALQPRPDVSHFSKGVLVKRSSGQRPFFIQFSNLTPDNEFSIGERQALAIAFLTDPELVPKLNNDLLRKAYGLTAAEITLAQELVAGDSLDDISRRLRRSKETLKTQLQSIFEKTNTHRQAQLVRLLMVLASTSL